MSAPTPTVFFWADMSGSSDGFFTLDDDVYGELDGVGVLAGDQQVDVTPQAFSCTISRGRSRELDEITAGHATLAFRNHGQEFQPTNTLSDFYGQIVPGKRFDVWAGSTNIFSGQSRDWRFEYEPGTAASSAIVELTDALGVLAAKEFDAWTTTEDQAGAAVTEVLNRGEVAYTGGRIIDDGAETIQANNVTWGSNVLAYLQLIARTDRGRLYASRTGSLIYRDRYATLNSSPAVSFAPDEFGCRYHAIAMEVGATFLANRVGVDREGGTLQTVEDTTAQTETGLGVLPLNLSGLLLTTDARSLALAEYLLSIYHEPELRISEVSVYLEDDLIDDAIKTTVLQLDIGDLVRVRFAPDGTNTDVDFYGLVEGIRHELAPSIHHVTLSLSAADSRVFLVLDDETYGTLDGPGVLAF